MAEEIRAKLEQKARGHEVGKDSLILPAEIAAVANCIGLFAVGYYKIQQLIGKHTLAYADLLAEHGKPQASSMLAQPKYS